MSSLGKAWQSFTGNVNVRRDSRTVIPGACYDLCNNALTEADPSGSTNSSNINCNPDSTFQVLLQNCTACISENNSNFTTLKHFADFVNACADSQDASQYQSLQALLSQEPTTIATQSTAEQTVSSSSLSSRESTSTQENLTLTTTNASGAQITVYETAASSSTPQSSGSSGQSQVRTIVPAVVVPVVVVGIAIIIFFVVSRRRRRQKPEPTAIVHDPTPWDKPQLHADGVRPELDGTVASAPDIPKTTAELPDNGVSIGELPARGLVEMGTEEQET